MSKRNMFESLHALIPPTPCTHFLKLTSTADGVVVVCYDENELERSVTYEFPSKAELIEKLGKAGFTLGPEIESRWRDAASLGDDPLELMRLDEIKFASTDEATRNELWDDANG